jgi:ubiquinone/menaquinone biosynthesis C-methylase UbiE
MGRQETEFLNGEGDQWYARNKDKPGIYRRNHIIADHISEPSSILEIGCGDGRYLFDLQNLYDCKCTGIDPSDVATTVGRERYHDINFICGTANHQFPPNEFDVVIYGFCLYLCDRDKLSRIAAIGDGVLRDKGHLIIHDFDPEHPHSVPYRHAEGLLSYKQDYSKLWLANPTYSLVNKTTTEDGAAVWVLKKDIAAGWPLEAAPC